MNEQIFDLTKADNLQLVGGKAYALGAMVRAGFTVPAGFVISAEVCMSMTPSLQSSILSYFDKLGAEYVAVRSSAINEDGVDAAWAGQLDTFLNCNRDTLMQNIQRCWESANSARAQSYAAQKALQATKVAVIVQAMIQSEVSGVAFSVHPVSNNVQHVVIEAGLGLGEAIVSGQITPDTYVVDKQSGQCVEKHVTSQQQKLVREVATGQTVWQATGRSGSDQKLTGPQIAAVSELTVALETFFTHPVDVEWAICDSTTYLLQSRPITTLVPEIIK